MEDIKCRVVGNLKDKRYNEMTSIVYSPSGLAPTQQTCCGGNHETKIVERNRFFEQAFETAQENECEVGDTIDAFNKKVNKSGVSPTVTTRPEGFKTAILAVDGFNQSIRADQTCFGTITTDGSSPKHNNRVVENYRIRKLTPKECGRLMGVRDDDIDTMSVNQSNSSLYHLFGDSIVVDVLMAIFKQMI